MCSWEVHYLVSVGSERPETERAEALPAELADQPYRVIVSKGPQAKKIELAPKMAGADLLLQASLRSKVALVITHGANTTATESLDFAKPMVVIPIFFDQQDNALRIAETGFGVRLDTQGHSAEEMLAAIDRASNSGHRWSGRLGRGP